MANCTKEAFAIDYNQIGKSSNSAVVYVDVLEPVESCNKQNASDYAAVTGATGQVFDATLVPEDKFGCSENVCFNSGTLKATVTATAGTITYLKAFDATEIATGVITFYVYLTDSATHTINFTIGDYSEGTTLTNSEVYATSVTSTGEGFYPVVIDLTTAPATVNGTGWTPSSTGIAYSVEIEGLTATDEFGVSSFQFFDSIEELQKNDTVALTCIDTFDGNDTTDIVEEACGQVGFDENSTSTEINLSVNKVSKNLLSIHPNAYVSDDTKAGLPALAKKVAETETINGIEYATVQVADIMEDECGWTIVSIPGCGASGSLLSRVNSPVPVTLPGDAFQILTSEQGAQYRGKILMAAQYAGKTVNISYPQEADVRVREVRNTFRDGLRTRLMVPITYKDGSEVFHVYENVYLTQFPLGFSASDSTPREFTFNVGTDDNGVRYKVIERI